MPSLIQSGRGNHFNVCCAHKGETGTDEPVLTRTQTRNSCSHWITSATLTAELRMAPVMYLAV